MSARRPTKLRIGWCDWTVEYLTKEQWEGNESLSEGNGGETHSSNHSIYVVDEHPSGKLNELAIKEVLLHEILHAVFHTANLGYGIVQKMRRDELEETIVGGMSGPLLAVLRDNPKLAEYLLAP